MLISDCPQTLLPCLQLTTVSSVPPTAHATMTATGTAVQSSMRQGLYKCECKCTATQYNSHVCNHQMLSVSATRSPSLPRPHSSCACCRAPPCQSWPGSRGRAPWPSSPGYPSQTAETESRRAAGLAWTDTHSATRADCGARCPSWQTTTTGAKGVGLLLKLLRTRLTLSQPLLPAVRRNMGTLIAPSMCSFCGTALNRQFEQARECIAA